MRYKALAKLHDLLPKDEQGSKIQLDKFLGSIRVLHASSFSLQIPTDGESFQFNPVLFSRKKTEKAQDGLILDESESLLTPDLQQKFASDRFKRGTDVKDCYAVDNGVYVYVDSDLKKALGVVRKMQGASVEDRKKFIHSPQRIIREQLGDDFSVDSIERLFLETEQYADNVLGLGLWQPPVIPWLKKQPNSWLPEKFGIKIGDTYIQIKHEDAVGVREEITKRFTTGFSDVKPEPFIYETDNGSVEIPITEESIKALDGLVGLATIINKVSKDELPTDEQKKEIDEIKSINFFIEVKDNIDELRHQATSKKRKSTASYNEPIVLKSSLKEHQKEVTCSPILVQLQGESC